ncbi:MAG: PIG-L deacetylase family protein [Acidimicrobiales bacterium]
MNGHLHPHELGTVLSVWAHPDDETFLAGGVMAAAAANGQRVVCVSATAGELGTDDPDRWPPDRLGQVRRWEAAAAMAVLGVSDHRFLDYPDGGLATLDRDEPIDRIASLIDEVAPDTILTFGPDGRTFHPDHQTVSDWVARAWDAAGGRGRLLHAALSEEHLEEWSDRYEQWQIYMSDERPDGVPADRLAVRLRLDQHLLDRKTTALCSMHTQISPSLALLGEDDLRASVAEECFVRAR